MYGERLYTARRRNFQPATFAHAHYAHTTLARRTFWPAVFAHGHYTRTTLAFIPRWRSLRVCLVAVMGRNFMGLTRY